MISIGPFESPPFSDSVIFHHSLRFNCWAQCHTVWKSHGMCSLGQLSWFCSVPTSSALPAHLLGRHSGWGERGITLDAVRSLLSSNQNTDVSSVLVLWQIQNTTAYRLLSIPARTSTLAWDQNALPLLIHTLFLDQLMQRERNFTQILQSSVVFKRQGLLWYRLDVSIGCQNKFPAHILPLLTLYYCWFVCTITILNPCFHLW